MVLDVAAVEKVLMQWVNNFLESRPDLEGCLDAVAIDGKTMRTSQKSEATTSPLTLCCFTGVRITLT